MKIIKRGDQPPEPLTPQYYVHQARTFHEHAATNFAEAAGNPDRDPNGILGNLIIALDYLIELEEARIQHHWIH